MLGEIKLYNSSGRYLRLSQEAWRTLLASARLWGWSPTVVGKPPVSIDIDHRPSQSDPRSNDYDMPRGQIVSERDARALAEALENSPDTQPGLPVGLLHMLCEFCHSGAFLISQAPPRPEPDTQTLRTRLFIYFNFKYLPTTRQRLKESRPTTAASR